MAVVIANHSNTGYTGLALIIMSQFNKHGHPETIARQHSLYRLRHVVIYTNRK